LHSKAVQGIERAGEKEIPVECVEVSIKSGSKKLRAGIYQLKAFGRPALVDTIIVTGHQGRGMREFAMSRLTACPAKQELRKAP
jgi:hypothetical protein